MATENLNLTEINMDDYVDGSVIDGNFKAIDAAMPDRIVAQGTSGIWTYRKWASGIYECWGTDDVSSTISAAWGSMYESTKAINLQAYPFAFTSIDGFSVAASCSEFAVLSVDMIGKCNECKTKPPAMYLTRPLAISEAKVFAVSVCVRGTWK